MSNKAAFYCFTFLYYFLIISCILFLSKMISMLLKSRQHDT